MDTIFGFALGTSIPIVPFPGIGAIIRIPKADRLSAMSSSRLRIFETRMPSSSVISYSVMVGPTVAVMVRTCTPKLFKTSTIRFLFAVCSFMSMYGLPSLSYFLSRSSVGYLYFVHGSLGFIGVLIFGSATSVLLSAPSSVSVSFTVNPGSSPLPASAFTPVSATGATETPASPKSTVWGCGSSKTSGSSTYGIFSSVFSTMFSSLSFPTLTLNFTLFVMRLTGLSNFLTTVTVSLLIYVRNIIATRNNVAISPGTPMTFSSH